MARINLSYESFSQMFGEVPDVELLIKTAQDKEIIKAADRRMFAQNPDGSNRYMVDLSLRIGALGISNIDIILLSRIAEDQALARYQHDRERSAHD